MFSHVYHLSGLTVFLLNVSFIIRIVKHGLVSDVLLTCIITLKYNPSSLDLFLLLYYLPYGAFFFLIS